MRTTLLAFCLAAISGAAAAQTGQIANQERTTAVNEVSLKALDMLNGATTDLTVAVGETARFGRLEITAETCRVPADDPKGDASVFLRIRDTREDEPRFTGWMFASSPALSALDHPRYDVWVVGCESR